MRNKNRSRWQQFYSSKSQRMNFWLPYTMIDEIRLHARLNGIGFSAALRDLIESGLSAPASSKKELAKSKNLGQSKKITLPLSGADLAPQR